MPVVLKVAVEFAVLQYITMFPRKNRKTIFFDIKTLVFSLQTRFSFLPGQFFAVPQ